MSDQTTNVPNEVSAPTTFGATSIDNDVSKFISELEQTYVDTESEMEDHKGGSPAPGEAQNTGNVGDFTANQAVDKSKVVNDSKEDPTERGLERLVAREVELRERESRLASTEKEMEALRARLSELEPRAVTEDLLNKIKLSPSEGLRAIGLDPDEVVRAALVEKLGDRANTPEMRETMERAKMRKEMEALKSQIRAAEMKQAAQEFYNKVDGGAREYVKNQEAISKYAPTVAAVLRTSPDHVYAEIMGEITRDAQVRSSREPDGDVISYEEAARRVETRWAGMKKLLAPETVVQPTPTPNASTPAPPGVAKTNAEAQVKSPPSNPKPPAAPLLPWLQLRQDEEEGIKEAIAEWKRLQK